MFRYSAFDRNLENACSHLRLEPDWPAILVICDLIRQNDTTPKYALQQIKKKISSQNPHTAFYALLVLESIVKNCGSPVHDEIAIKENCEAFTQLIETTTHENVKIKMLELIQAWAFAFRSMDRYQAVKDTMTILKTKGFIFPELKEADAMFTSDTAPAWHDGSCCHHCRVQFSFTQRKHHCRNCGQIFCSQCSSKTCTLPKFGIEKDVRVCDSCFIQVHKPNSGPIVKASESDLPAEYLSSSLSQQSQTPARKSEAELKEEEELQLALALSQSEAEQQSQRNRSVTAFRSPSHRPKSPELGSSSPITVAPTGIDERSDPELAKYLNRDYWEQRGANVTATSKMAESPASPSAPSPMVTPQPSIASFNMAPLKNANEDIEIDSFATNMRTQVEIFVNRMKSNSSRGRSISTDSSVQTLFLNLTTFHSRLLGFIKEADDKRMWYEQLQDKLTQIKDSRAALDVLRQEHQDKLRQIAEEQERQRQLQMAHKLELMRKKKQEYLQYQRQLALQRIQEQEREMQMHQEQQKVMYNISAQQFGPMGSVMSTNMMNSPMSGFPMNPPNQQPIYGSVLGVQQPGGFSQHQQHAPQTQAGIPFPGMIYGPSGSPQNVLPASQQQGYFYGPAQGLETFNPHQQQFQAEHISNQTPQQGPNRVAGHNSNVSDTQPGTQIPTQQHSQQPPTGGQSTGQLVTSQSQQIASTPQPTIAPAEPPIASTDVAPTVAEAELICFD